MNTVVLVHGVTYVPKRMRFMAAYLRKQGWTVLLPELLPANGSLPLETLAGMLADYIAAKRKSGERIDLIGFSMGGLVCRYYLQALGGAALTDRFISISTPHAGTRIATFFGGAGMRQMRPGSSFLNALNAAQDRLANVACSVFYSPFDFVILPAAAALLPGARVYRFPILGHPLMIYHPAVYRKLAGELRRSLAPGTPDNRRQEPGPPEGP